MVHFITPITEAVMWQSDRQADELVILSLGGGVQSSTLLLMMEHGEVERADVAIFADTMAEPASLYQYLDYLRTQTSIPILTCSQGNLEQHILNGVRTGARVSQAPFYVCNPNKPGDRKGMLWRACTRYFKLAPLRREYRKQMAERGVKRAVSVIGISLDECSRMKDSGVKYLRNEYPLIDMRITRTGCLQWMSDHGYRLPSKSACYFCQYTSNARWIEMRKHEPDTFARAVAFDAEIRTNKLPGVHGDCFVHRRAVPLMDATDDGGQMALDLGTGERDFQQECEGMCGV
jgi:hypothetical protein